MRTRASRPGGAAGGLAEGVSGVGSAGEWMLRGAASVVVTGEDGVRSLAYSLAVLESLRTGSRVTVDAGDRP